MWYILVFQPSKCRNSHFQPQIWSIWHIFPNDSESLSKVCYINWKNRLKSLINISKKIPRLWIENAKLEHYFMWLWCLCRYEVCLENYNQWTSRFECWVPFQIHGVLFYDRRSYLLYLSSQIQSTGPAIQTVKSIFDGQMSREETKSHLSSEKGGVPEGRM